MYDTFYIHKKKKIRITEIAMFSIMFSAIYKNINVACVEPADLIQSDLVFPHSLKLGKLSFIKGMI